MGIKRSRILRRFQKYKLSDKMHLKSNSRIKIFVYTQGAPCVHLYSGIHFFRCILSKVSSYFWNLHKIRRHLIHIMHDHKNHDLRASGQWTKKYYFDLPTLLDGLAPTVFILKIKIKSWKSAHPTVQYMVHIEPKQDGPTVQLQYRAYLYTILQYCPFKT
jgi:hypothetical protein